MRSRWRFCTYFVNLEMHPIGALHGESLGDWRGAPSRLLKQLSSYTRSSPLLRRENIKIKAGRITRIRMGANIIPPTTTTASGF
jgi:hypothetical protein